MISALTILVLPSIVISPSRLTLTPIGLPLRAVIGASFDADNFLDFTVPSKTWYLSISVSAGISARSSAIFPSGSLEKASSVGAKTVY